MIRVSTKQAVVAAVGVLATLGTVWLVIESVAPPAVDHVLAAEVLPVIDEELERGPWPGLLSRERPELASRWFCVERVIEIRQTGTKRSVGLVALCEEYARDGDVLLTGSGEHAPKVVDLVAEPDGYRVIRVDVAPDGHAGDWWLEHGFSAAGVARLDHLLLAGETTAPQAREAFSLPPDAPVRHA